ncbi:TIGR02679 family protein [Halobacillus trueperi]|uniref:TIGR02679 family protein n=1 Tax=Halobacillus trueperi TaxID=156205 RepID=A0A3D8VMI4_9BACI|nr:TIGR02679 family protein [Halobacillus trueperi]RDY70532.1 TIGR02679 family protein [Halobacillus trueperi]
MDKVEEAVTYFRSEPFHRLFLDFRKKYESLGRIGGSVSMKKYKEEEVEAIAGFLGKGTEEVERRRLQLSDFEERLLDTKFEGLSLVNILESYFGESIVSKAEQAAKEEIRIEQLFLTIKQNHPSLSFWVDVLREKPPTTYSFYPWMQEEREFLSLIEKLDLAYNNLPSENKWERLPLFSQRIAQDPHAFDIGKKLGRLWIHLLSVESSVAVPKTSVGVTELLEEYGLLRDDLMNFVTCANLLAEYNGSVHPVWQEAFHMNLVRNVTLREVITLDRIYTEGGSRVFVVENSGVCSMLLDEVPSAPLVSTQGQVKLAAWKLLDFLAAEGTTLYYAGDFDPEGLRMADIMMNRYPGQVVLWRMATNDYKDSGAEVELSETRLKKLDSIKAPELAGVVKEMRKIEKAGYQESLVETMIEDLKQ